MTTTKNGNITPGNGIDGNMFQAGILYLEKIGRTVCVGGNVQTKLNTDKDGTINLCYPTVLGKEYGAYSGIQYLNAYIAAYGVSLYASYEPTIKAFVIQNVTNQVIPSGTWIKINGVYISVS